MSNEFTREQIAGILMREGNICAMFGANPNCERQASTANHRLNRSTGGTDATENGCAICWRCNGDIESDAELAEIARQRGVKLRAGDNPRTVALWCSFYGQWVQLVGDDCYLTGERDITTRPQLRDPEQLDVPL